MMKILNRILLSVWLAWGLAGVDVAMADPPMDAVIALDRTVHFEQPNGQPVAVDAATYRVERRDDTIQLTPETGQPAIVLQAERLSLEMPVLEPAVLSLMRNSDEHLLIYADPHGAVLGVIGSYSGIRTREILTLKPSLLSPPIVSAPHLPLGGNVLPGVPRLKSVSSASFAHLGALVPFANVQVTIVMHNFLGSSNSRISYRIVPPSSITGQSACMLTPNPRITVSDSFPIDQAGEGRISLPGWFTSSGTCAIGIELLLPGKTEPARLVAGPIFVDAPRRVVVNQTWNLKDTLTFRASSSIGTCEGTSVGPSNYAVGIVNVGGDLGLRIRSGPLGTECQYISKPWLLPEGVTLVATTWERVSELPSGQTQAKCCVVNAFGHNCITMPPHVEANFNRGTAPIVTGEHTEFTRYYSVTSADRQVLEDGVIIHENTSPRILTLVKPMWGKLQCTNTGFNDHGVKLVLREMVLDGPPGLTFP